MASRWPAIRLISDPIPKRGFPPAAPAAGAATGVCAATGAGRVNLAGAAPGRLTAACRRAIASGDGKQTILVPANALEAFGDAFKMLKGRA